MLSHYLLKKTGQTPLSTPLTISQINLTCLTYFTHPMCALAADMILKLLPEVFQQAQERRRRGLTQGTEGGVHQGLARLSRNSRSPGCPCPARCGSGFLTIGACPPGKGCIGRRTHGEKYRHRAGEIHRTDTLIHHQHGPGAQGAADFGHGAEIDGGVQGLGGDDAGRSAARLAHLELAARLQTAAVIVDQGPQGDARRDLHDLRGLDMADDLIDLGAAGVRGAQGFIPGPAFADNCRHAGQGLHIVDDGGFFPQAGHPGKRRLHAGIAPLALDGFDQRGFLAADVAAEAGAHLDIKGKIRAEEVVRPDNLWPGPARWPD